LQSFKEITPEQACAHPNWVMGRKISVDSPIGKGILGKKVGEISDIQTPGGLMQFEIISITR
jgi:transcription elongation GreA/GreB family factor